MRLVLVLGLLMNLVALPLAGRRAWFLYRLVRSGKPAPDRFNGETTSPGQGIANVLREVFGQRRLLKWTVPGLAHFFTFWAFVILLTVYIEAYGALFQPGFEIPLVGTWPVLGFLQDAIALAVAVAIVVFGVIRYRNAPARLGRRSRFLGSHLGGAWLVLGLILVVVLSMFAFRGAATNTGDYANSGAFASRLVGDWLSGLSTTANSAIEGTALLLHIGVMLVFLIEVLHSKHLHVFVAPINVYFKRNPVALGAARPLVVDGKPFDIEAIDDLDEDATLGIAKIEDFTWKGMLDFEACTECGRCQSQCPAWNTDKPLSPKLLIMNLRDHAYAKAPYLFADEAGREQLPDAVKAEAQRPLVGPTEGEPWRPSGGAVIDPDVLWSCVTCGACVEECPVDIEHVDHIIDMRRSQVLIESEFPSELGGLFRNLEKNGNPWGLPARARMDWAKDLQFPVPVLGEDVESLENVDYLFWVGCAGAYEDRAKKTTRAVAELLHTAGVSFAVLGEAETCTGDSARRAGNEMLFQMLAQSNIETLNEAGATKIVVTCAHCLNTLANEYPQLGGTYEVVHHTVLLNDLVKTGRLVPVKQGEQNGSVTYHDPCYLGRHNRVYSPPRELIGALPGLELVEMPRNSERSFCCGAGGSRMWMEENLGSRINDNRTQEALATGAEKIAVGCPFCKVMLSDGVDSSVQAGGTAEGAVDVVDVAQLLLDAVREPGGSADQPV